MRLARWLLDSDAAICMCKYGLVEDLAAALGVSLDDICILPQLRYQLRVDKPAKTLEKLGSEMAVAQAVLLIEHASEVVVLQDSANAALIAGTPDIDGGELALFAALLGSEDSGLITGDKRSLVALSKVGGHVEASLSWLRILCTEEAMKILIKHFGHAYVADKVRARPDANMALSIAFGRTAPNSEQSVDEGLRSYIGELVGNTSGRYIPRHFDAP